MAVVNALKSNRDGSGYEVIARQVSCEFNKCIEEASAFVDELGPNAVVMLGEYPGRAMVTVERVAINYNDSTRYGICDEAGYAPQGTKVVEDGPAAYLSTPVWKSSLGAPRHRRDVVPVPRRSTLPLRRIVRDLRQAGIPADISGDAGTLMCNHLMYGILHACSGRDIVAGWVHLPALPVRLGVLILGSRRWRRAPRRRCDVLVTHRRWRQKMRTSGCRR